VESEAIAMASARGLTTLIEDVLSFTRLEAGQLTVEQAPIAIADVFSTLDAMVRRQMVAKGIEFVCEPCAPDLVAMADRIRVVQVCANLLVNALRATAAGGAVSLRCTSDDHSISIGVTDTGVGVPPDKLGMIFSPFTQLGRALKRPGAKALWRSEVRGDGRQHLVGVVAEGGDVHRAARGRARPRERLLLGQDRFPVGPDEVGESHQGTV
jgi:signal transduction histidine kinase